jgi:mannosyltransferase OCH1-like enzyme
MKVIPKVIWQTHEDSFDLLPDYVIDAVNSWKEKNLDWEYRYFNSKDRSEFILSEFGQEWLDIYDSCIFGVMKADVWKYLIIYKYGGLYTDIDYLCKKPIDSWVSDDYSMVVGMDEEPNEIACHTFAAEAGSVFLKSILDVIKENIKNINYKKEFFSYHATGPTAFTDGIKNVFNITDDLDLVNNIEILNSSLIGKENRFYCYGEEDSLLLTNVVVEDLMGRTRWFDKKYDWLEESKNIQRRKINE